MGIQPSFILTIFRLPLVLVHLQVPHQALHHPAPAAVLPLQVLAEAHLLQAALLQDHLPVHQAVPPPVLPHHPVLVVHRHLQAVALHQEVVLLIVIVLVDYGAVQESV